MKTMLSPVFLFLIIFFKGKKTMTNFSTSALVTKKQANERFIQVKEGREVKMKQDKKSKRKGQLSHLSSQLQKKVTSLIFGK